MAGISPSRRYTAIALAALLVSAGVVAAPALRRAFGQDPDALWRIVHDRCTPHLVSAHTPAPCDSVDRARGFAILKDRRGATQLLLIPTDRIAGIESPGILSPAARPYWQAAWEARRDFERRAKRPVPREDYAMAINSKYRRSQDQLHIHIDCVRADVQEALRANENRIGQGWSDLPVALAGRNYRARRVDGVDFGAQDPFKLLAEDPGARADMARQSLAAIGYTFKDGTPGFVLLSSRADPPWGLGGHAEDLLDKACRVLAAR
jgi:CDP-diacylglycerol pyrophosphatase